MDSTIDLFRVKVRGNRYAAKAESHTHREATVSAPVLDSPRHYTPENRTHPNALHSILANSDPRHGRAID